jgi:hypothetical protein
MREAQALAPDGPKAQIERLIKRLEKREDING